MMKRMVFLALAIAIPGVSFAGDKPKNSQQSRPAYGSDADSYQWLFENSLSKRTVGVSVSPTDVVLRTQLNLTTEKPGVVVTKVIANAPAAKAGLKLNDILLAADGKPLRSGKDVQTLVRIQERPVTLAILRHGKPVTLRLAAVKDTKLNLTTVRNLTFYQASKRYVIGIRTKSADAALAAHLVIPPKSGLVITHVDAKSPAATAGLKVHDVILSVNGKYVGTSDALGKALGDAKGKAVKLEFVRAGRKQTCNVTPKRNQTHPYYIVGGPKSPSSYWLRTQNYPIRYSTAVWPATNLQSQVNRLSQQISDLQSTLNSIKKTLAEQENHKKNTGKKKK